MAKTTKTDYDVRYVPEFTQRAIAGAKGKGSHPRPFLFDVRSFKLTVPGDNPGETGTKVHTYLLFGGVPTKKLHNALEDAGFTVRRRAKYWDDKKGNRTYIVDKDNECYAVYYTFSPIGKDQAALIAKLFLATAKVADSGKTFLCPNWNTVHATWGDKDEWLDICSVDPDATKKASASAPAPAPEDEDVIDIDDIDALI